MYPASRSPWMQRSNIFIPGSLEKADPRNLSRRLLRAQAERPRGCCAAENSDEIAPP
jgi:hypothetical protein